MGDGFSCNDGTFFQGPDATVGDGYAPVGPLFLPWENCMGRGQRDKQDTDIATTRPKGHKGLFGKNIMAHQLNPTVNTNWLNQTKIT